MMVFSGRTVDPMEEISMDKRPLQNDRRDYPRPGITQLKNDSSFSHNASKLILHQNNNHHSCLLNSMLNPQTHQSEQPGNIIAEHCEGDGSMINPARAGMRRTRKKVRSDQGALQYTCPMHPELSGDQLMTKCGMDWYPWRQKRRRWSIKNC